MTMQTGCDQLHIPVISFASHIAETNLKTDNSLKMKALPSAEAVICITDAVILTTVICKYTITLQQ
jgi:hypothetical protein